jgi:hypothetical protein
LGAEYWVQQRVASCSNPNESSSGNSKDRNNKRSTTKESEQGSSSSQISQHGLEFHFDKGIGFYSVYIKKGGCKEENQCLDGDLEFSLFFFLYV